MLCPELPLPDLSKMDDLGEHNCWRPLRWAHMWDRELWLLAGLHGGARRKGWQWETWQGTERQRVVQSCSGSGGRGWVSSASGLLCALLQVSSDAHLFSPFVRKHPSIPCWNTIKNLGILQHHGGPPARCSRRSPHESHFQLQKWLPLSHTAQQAEDCPLDKVKDCHSSWTCPSRIMKDPGDAPLALSRGVGRCWGQRKKADEVGAGEVLQLKALRSAVRVEFPKWTQLACTRTALRTKPHRADKTSDTPLWIKVLAQAQHALSKRRDAAAQKGQLRYGVALSRGAPHALFPSLGAQDNCALKATGA